jgi:hypothetical protein
MILTPSSLSCPPRFATLRNPDRPTLGPEIDAVSVSVSRSRLYGWQRYIADVCAELDPDSVVYDASGRIIGGRRWFSTVVIKTPRQQGKSVLLDSEMVHNSRVFKLRRKGVYVAQKQEIARERIIVELEQEKLSRSPVWAGTYKPSLANSGQRITWRDTRGFIHAAAPSKKVGHGLTEIDDVYLDEAWSLPFDVVTGLGPTTMAAPDPVLWVVSTPGDGTDDLFIHFEEQGRISLTDPDTRTAFFDWSAEDDDDRDDPAVWARVMPSWGLGFITEQRIRVYRGQYTDEQFDRSYLARRPKVSAAAAIDAGKFAANANAGAPLTLRGPVCAAFAIPPDRSWCSLAVAGAGPDGRVAVLVRRDPGTRWLADAALGLAQRSDVTLFELTADRANGVGGLIDDLAGRGLSVVELTANDVASAAGTLHDLNESGLIVHDNQPELIDAVAGSRRRPLASAWAFHVLEAETDQDPLLAVSFAVAAYRRHFGVGVLGGIR